MPHRFGQISQIRVGSGLVLWCLSPDPWPPSTCSQGGKMTQGVASLVVGATAYLARPPERPSPRRVIKVSATGVLPMDRSVAEQTFLRHLLGSPAHSPAEAAPAPQVPGERGDGRLRSLGTRSGRRSRHCGSSSPGGEEERRTEPGWAWGLLPITLRTHTAPTRRWAVGSPLTSKPGPFRARNRHQAMAVGHVVRIGTDTKPRAIGGLGRGLLRYSHPALTSSSAEESPRRGPRGSGHRSRL